jgi:hypothetical protein
LATGETNITRLLLGNIEPGTSDDEIRELLEKYGFPAFDEIEHTPGAGSRPAAVLTFLGADPAALAKVQQRFHNMHWKNRKLTAPVLRDSFA